MDVGSGSCLSSFYYKQDPTFTFKGHSLSFPMFHMKTRSVFCFPCMEIIYLRDPNPTLRKYGHQLWLLSGKNNIQTFLILSLSVSMCVYAYKCIHKITSYL